MLRIVTIPCLLLVSAIPVFGQTTGAGYADALSPSLASVAKVMHGTIRDNIAAAAEQMPADEYAFRPTQEVRTFAQLIGHIINTNLFFCSQVTHEQLPPGPPNYEEVTDKATLSGHLVRL